MIGEYDPIQHSLKRLWRDAINRGLPENLIDMYEDAIGRMIDEKVDELIREQIRRKAAAK